MAKKRKQRSQTDAARHMDNQHRAPTLRLPVRFEHPDPNQVLVGLTEAGPTERFVGFVGERFWMGTPKPPLPDLPPGDDGALLAAADWLEEMGQVEVADALRKLPPAGADEAAGRACPPLRCIGGPHHMKPSGFAGWQKWTASETHFYAEKSATWRGLTLRWYEWEERPKVDPEKVRQMGMSVSLDRWQAPSSGGTELIPSKSVG